MEVVKRWWTAFVSLLFPRCCIVCGHPLVKGEACICVRCDLDLPRTNYHLKKENPVEMLFWGKIALERSTSYFFYNKGSDYCRILYRLKYNGEKEIGAAMGRCLATELLPSGFFEGIDLLVPVPLHPKKQKLRGYNQSEWIARGISGVTSIPLIGAAVGREKNTETQTRKTIAERWDNVEGVFVLHTPEAFINKHVLIIDDVLTTGATIVACASAFNRVEGVRISILTLAVVEH